jgi:hypothetical protein
MSTPWPLCLTGRSGVIRTRDPLVPNEVRYQAALHSANQRPCIYQRPGAPQERYREKPAPAPVSV